MENWGIADYDAGDSRLSRKRVRNNHARIAQRARALCPAKHNSDLTMSLSQIALGDSLPPEIRADEEPGPHHQIACGIESREEAGYWLGMVMHRAYPRRVLAALRILLTTP